MNEFFSGLSNQHFVGELSLGVVFFRLFLAVVFGGLVGFERERKRKPAGFRTYILVCFGAAIVSMIQDQLRIHIIDFESTHSGLATVIKTDLGRLGAQVISGIGFLGAGGEHCGDDYRRRHLGYRLCRPGYRLGILQYRTGGHRLYAHYHDRPQDSRVQDYQKIFRYFS